MKSDFTSLQIDSDSDTNSSSEGYYSLPYHKLTDIKIFRDTNEQELILVKKNGVQFSSLKNELVHELLFFRSVLLAYTYLLTIVNKKLDS